MSKNLQNAQWGFLLPISPVFALAYLGILSTRTCQVFRGIVSDKWMFYPMLMMMISGSISALSSPDPKTGFLVMWVPLVFMFIYALGRWGVQNPTIVIQGIVFGCGFVGAVVLAARVFHIELVIAGVPILTNFADVNLRGNLLGMADNGLAAMLEAGVTGGLGLALCGTHRRCLNIAASVTSLLGILCTYSRGSIVATTVAVCLLLMLSRERWQQYGKYVAIALGLLLALILSWPPLASRLSDLMVDKARLLIWKTSFNMIHDHLLIGIGPGNYGDFFSIYRFPELTEHFSSPHSLYLFILTGWGLVGSMVFFSWLAMSVLRPLWKNPTPIRIVAFAMMVSFWVHVLFNDLFIAHVPILMGLIMHSNLDEDLLEPVSRQTAPKVQEAQRVNA